MDPIIAQALDPMYEEVLSLVFKAVASGLGMLLIWIGTQFARKLGWEVGAKEQAALKYFAEQAAKKMEEISAAYLKKTGQRMSAEEQMAGAVADVIQNLPKKDVQKVESAVTAALPELGIGASGPILMANAKPVVVVAPPPDPQPAPVQ